MKKEFEKEQDLFREGFPIIEDDRVEIPDGSWEDNNHYLFCSGCGVELKAAMFLVKESRSSNEKDKSPPRVIGYRLQGQCQKCNKTTESDIFYCLPYLPFKSKPIP